MAQTSNRYKTSTTASRSTRGASGNTVGGLTAGARNIISGNKNDGVEISGSGTTGDVVEGNYIGLDATGTTDNGYYYGSDPLGNESDGVEIDTGASSDTIGGTTAAARNIISGNRNGVEISGSGTTLNLVEGNYIGLDVTGTTAYDSQFNDLGNSNDGVEIDSGASGNTIGGSTAARQRRVGKQVRGHRDHGTRLDRKPCGRELHRHRFDRHHDVCHQREISGSGDDPYLGNAYYGVAIFQSASANTIGGAIAGYSNVISGNLNDGILLYASANVVQGNFIGTDAAGTTTVDSYGKPLGNGVGVEIDASSNTIGGTTSNSRNVISGNGTGVEIYGPGTSGNVVEGDYIGTDDTGTTTTDANGNSLGNSMYGVWIDNGPSDNTVGGTIAGSGDVISGNGIGVALVGMPSSNFDAIPSGNLVVGNRIGTDFSGTTAYDSRGNPLGNTEGLFISWAMNNTIGGAASGSGNVISGNSGAGIEIAGRETTGNVVEGNFIGTDATGSTVFDSRGNRLGNGGDGIQISNLEGSSASDNTIGGTASGAGNVISGNAEGVEIDGAQTTGNVLLGNWIGTNYGGTSAVDSNSKPLGNTDNGVLIDGADANTIGGTASGGGNVISGNTNQGVEIEDGATGNVLEGNKIGTNAAGRRDRQWHGRRGNRRTIRGQHDRRHDCQGT